MDTLRFIHNLRQIFSPDSIHMTDLLNKGALMPDTLPIAGQISQTMHSAVADYSHLITAEIFPVSKAGRASALYRHKLPNSRMLEESLLVQAGQIHNSEGSGAMVIEQLTFRDTWKVNRVRLYDADWLSFLLFTRAPFTVVANIRQWDTSNGGKKFTEARQIPLPNFFMIGDAQYDFDSAVAKIRWVNTFPHNIIYSTSGGTHIHDERNDRKNRLESWLRQLFTPTDKATKFILESLLDLSSVPAESSTGFQESWANGIEALSGKVYLPAGDFFKGARLEKKLSYNEKIIKSQEALFQNEDPLNPCYIIVR